MLMRFRGTVTTALREGIFDPQGKAVRDSLAELGYSQVEQVRIGKDIVVGLDAKSLEEAESLLEKMAEKLLVNPVLETFTIRVERE